MHRDVVYWKREAAWLYLQRLRPDDGSLFSNIAAGLPTPFSLTELMYVGGVESNIRTFEVM
jgi:hypothetical protein